MKKIGLILIALLFLASVSIAKDDAGSSKGSTMSGWVTDANCAAKKDADLSNGDCAKKCAEKGVKLVFVSDNERKVYQVDNQDSLKGHEGHHVSVTGKVENDTLHVDKLAMLKAGEDKK